MLGAEFVEKSLASADDFNMPMHRLTTGYCWAAVWESEEFPKNPSMLNLAMLAALNRPHGLKMHVDGASQRRDQGRNPRGAAAGGDLLRHPGRRRPGRGDRAWADLVAIAYNVLPMDGETFRTWARLMHRKSNTFYEDAMIAAMAIVHDLTILTRNVTDFEHFDVSFLNPFKTTRN